MRTIIMGIGVLMMLCGAAICVQGIAEVARDAATVATARPAVCLLSAEFMMPDRTIASACLHTDGHWTLRGDIAAAAELDWANQCLWLSLLRQLVPAESPDAAPEPMPATRTAIDQAIAANPIVGPTCAAILESFGGQEI